MLWPLSSTSAASNSVTARRPLCPQHCAFSVQPKLYNPQYSFTQPIRVIGDLPCTYAITLAIFSPHAGQRVQREAPG